MSAKLKGGSGGNGGGWYRLLPAVSKAGGLYRLMFWPGKFRSYRLPGRGRNGGGKVGGGSMEITGS